MRKLLTSLFMLPFLAHADLSQGLGEHNYGPDTSENVACEYAFNKAKEDSLRRYYGENIEAFTRENCQSSTGCTIDIDTYVNLGGVLKRVVNKNSRIVETLGHKTCVVVVETEVESLKNKIKFQVYGKLNYVVGEPIDFSFVSETSGYVVVFNLYSNVYIPIFVSKVTALGEEQKVTSGEKTRSIRATLPKEVNQSKELLVFLFVKEPVRLRPAYTTNEFRSLLDSIDSTNRRTIYRYVNIDRIKK